MTPQELKNSILQLAIQGKLVEQRPEEGTGEELYRQIQTEKKRLIKEGKIKKDKPLPEIAEDEIPFDIPESWRWVRLSQLVSVLNGDRGKNYPAKSTLSHKGIPFISALNLDGKSVIEDDNLLCLSEQQYEKLGNGKLVRDDIVVCIRGSLGKHGRYPFDKGAIASSLVILRLFINESITAKFLMMYLDTPLFFTEIRRYDNGTAQPNLAAKSLEMFLLPLPPLSEQKRIVAKIEELLPYIDRYAASYERLEQVNTEFPEDMKKSVLQYAIQGKLVEQRAEEGTGEELYRQIQEEKKRLIKEGKIKKEKPLPEIAEDEIPFDIPGSWKWVRVAQIVTLNPKNDLADDLETSFIPMPCVVDGFRNQHTFEIKLWKDIKKGFTHFAEGDVGVAKITPCFQNRKSVIFRNLKNGYGAGTTELTVVRTINDTVLPEYLLWLFKTEYFIANGVKSFTGTAGQQRIHKDYLATCLIPLPPLAEQKRIVAKLDEILPLCERLK